jgi:hypothetical protein
MRFYTYMHTRLSDNKVFYIGTGHGRRAWNTARNPHWKKTVAKHGYRVDICAEFETDREALQHEVFLIACFRDLYAPLVNYTDGGDDIAGFKKSLEERAKMSVRNTGANSPRYGKPGTMLGKKMPAGFADIARKVNTGKVLSSETKAKISAENKGRPSKTKGMRGIHTPEGLEKIRAARARQAPSVMSAEGRARVSAARKAYWAAKKAAQNV